jgi:hypothetical protein
MDMFQERIKIESHRFRIWNWKEIKEYSLLGCSATQFGYSLTFWRRIWSPFSGSKSKTSQTLPEVGSKLNFAYAFTLKMEAILSCNTGLSMTTWRYNPEDCTLHSHCCENLKSSIIGRWPWGRLSSRWEQQDKEGTMWENIDVEELS